MYMGVRAETETLTTARKNQTGLPYSGLLAGILHFLQRSRFLTVLPSGRGGCLPSTFEKRKTSSFMVNNHSLCDGLRVIGSPAHQGCVGEKKVQAIAKARTHSRMFVRARLAYGRPQSWHYELR